MNRLGWTASLIAVIILLCVTFLARALVWHKTDCLLPSAVVQSLLPLLPFKPIPVRKPANLQEVEQDIRDDRRQGPAAVPNSDEIQASVEIFQGQKVYTLSPKQGAVTKHILYFHGGAYTFSITSEHWQFLQMLALRTHSRVLVPLYPLAPEHKVTDTLAFAQALYRDRVLSSEPKKWILMGDSAGGGLALALAQQLAAQNLPEPQQLILASPWLDISMQNPEIDKVQAQDPVLSALASQEEGKMYAGALDVHDPRVSPLYGTLEGLPPISLYTGTEDILHPDAEKLTEQMKSKGITMNVQSFPRMMHCWFLMPVLEKTSIIQKISEQISVDP
jgi:acetyl esterase/lipase